MAFTYDPEDLATALNRLRFLIQDTTDQGHFFEDAEIQFTAEQEVNIYRAAAELCRAAAAKFAKLPGHEGQLKLEAEEKSKTYMQLAAKYDEKADEIDSDLSQPGTSGLSLPTISEDPPAFTRALDFY